jgi:hypothetical protein
MIVNRRQPSAVRSPDVKFSVWYCTGQVALRRDPVSQFSRANSCVAIINAAIHRNLVRGFQIAFACSEERTKRQHKDSALQNAHAQSLRVDTISASIELRMFFSPHAAFTDSLRKMFECVLCGVVLVLILIKMVSSNSETRFKHGQNLCLRQYVRKLLSRVSTYLARQSAGGHSLIGHVKLLMTLVHPWDGPTREDCRNETLNPIQRDSGLLSVC